MQDSTVRPFQNNSAIEQISKDSPQEIPLFVGSENPLAYLANADGTLVKVDSDGTEYVERGRISLDQESAPTAPLTDAERAQVHDGAPRVLAIGNGIELHGTPTDADGNAISGPTGHTLPEQTLINGQAAVVRTREGQTPPAGYVQVNRRQRRAMAVNIRKQAIKQGKRLKSAKSPGGARARQSANALSACSGYRTIMES